MPRFIINTDQLAEPTHSCKFISYLGGTIMLFCRINTAHLSVGTGSSISHVAACSLSFGIGHRGLELDLYHVRSGTLFITVYGCTESLTTGDAHRPSC